MQVRDVMSTQPHYLQSNATIRDVAQIMRDNKSGFEPLTDGSKVKAVVTDRDLVVRGLAEGKSPDEPATSISTEKVLYTFEDKSLDEAIDNMTQQQVQRLLVLNNQTDKDLVGIVTIGDIADKCDDAELAKKITKAASHYK
ncbi:CBS domain-containing protein [Aliidiomarina sp. Khilg15.8]